MKWINKIKGFLGKWDRPDAERPRAEIEPAFGTKSLNNIGEEKAAEYCPYCKSKKFVKRGKRKKKLEIVQLYKCGQCQRTFTAQFVKGKHYPMNLIIDGLSYYNLGFGLEDTCRILGQKFGVPVPGLNGPSGAKPRIFDNIPSSSTLAGWIKQYSNLCRYSRLRHFAKKMYKPQDTVEVMSMAHRQIFRFLYHRAKMRLTLQEFKNGHFEPLKDYLDGVSSETPHQYFQKGMRISEIKTKFDKSQMIVRAKQNYANRLADFVLQAVKDKKKRHEVLQQFFVANDSVTVASEVPVYIRREDIEHMQNVLKFKVVDEEEGIKVKKRKGKGDELLKGRSTSAAGRSGAGVPVPKLPWRLRRRTEGTVYQQQTISAPGRSTSAALRNLPRLLTGHIDLLQVRNGQIHILDYKPNAAKEKPIEQLTWYALALSRLTGLRLYEFKCAWFDEKDYFEFYPLHVVKKLSDKKRTKRIWLKRKGMVEIPKDNAVKTI